MKTAESKVEGLLGIGESPSENIEREESEQLTKSLACQRISGAISCAASARGKGKVFIKTFGCQMNHYDSEKVAALLVQDYSLVSSAEEADLIFVNTCSVRDKAEHKLFSLLGCYRSLKNQNPRIILGVGGCVAQQEGEEIARRVPYVDFIVGTHNLSLVPSLVSRCQVLKDEHGGGEGRGEGPRATQVAIDYRDEWEDLPNEMYAAREFAASSGGSPVRALVAIQRGCDKHCAFCVVPGTRGPEVSRSLEEILREVRFKASLGAKEIVLLGQTVNSYGKDLKPRIRFPRLIEEVAAISGVKRIRFSSPHPQDVNEELIDIYGSVAQLSPHLHLPLQSGSDRVLKAMNRNYRVRRYLEIVEKVRKRVPAIAITTDIIVGFPQETEADFMATMDVVSQVNYHLSYTFKYSRRPNTAAVVKYTNSDEIPEPVKQERLARLQQLQDQISFAHNRRLVGRTVEVLVESALVQGQSSRARGRIPENTLVDITAGEVFTQGQGQLFEDRSLAAFSGNTGRSVDCAYKSGDIVPVIVTAASPHGLRGLA